MSSLLHSQNANARANSLCMYLVSCKSPTGLRDAEQGIVFLSSRCFGNSHVVFSVLVTSSCHGVLVGWWLFFSEHEGLVHAPAGTLELDEPAVVHDAVYDCGGELVIGEDRAPFAETRCSWRRMMLRRS